MYRDLGLAPSFVAVLAQVLASAEFYLSELSRGFVNSDCSLLVSVDGDFCRIKKI